MIRVLHIVNSLTVGGVETTVMNCLRYFQKDKDFQVGALVIGSPQGTVYEKECKERGIEVVYARYAPWRIDIPILQDIVNWFRCQHHIYKEVRRIKPDIVHTHGTYTLPYTMFLKLCTGVKVHVHKLASNPYRFSKGFVLCARLAFNLFGVYSVCVTKRQARLAQKRYRFKNYFLIRNGVDFNRFRNIYSNRKNVRNSLGIEDSTFVIGCVANFFKVKNHYFLVHLFNEFLKQKPDSLLMFVGDGTEYDTIKQLVFDLGLKEKCLFLGTRTDVIQLYSAMDLFMLTSFSESCSNATIEAQKAGLRCVVASSIPDDVVVTTNVNRIPLDAPKEQWLAAMRNELPHDAPTGTFDDFSIERMGEELKFLYKSCFDKI